MLDDEPVKIHKRVLVYGSIWPACNSRGKVELSDDWNEVTCRICLRTSRRVIR